MTVSLKHAFTSAKSDGGDSSLVQPSNWNAEHQLTLANNRVLGRNAGTDGAAQELTGSDLRTLTGLATSDSPQFTAIELGHASDTTIARSGAGDITIEGNAVYRAGGTDVPVTDGGTGRSTGTTAYALIATGTTATGAQQTLASGATTEILVGGGASALPVWTTATGSGAPVRATSPTFTTSTLHPAGTVGSPSITASGDTDTGLWFPAADTIAASTGGSERMRITSSGNVGIGTTSPGHLLSVAGNVQSDSWIGRGNVSAPSADASIFRAADNTLGLATNSTERLRITSSGNVGIGTTTNGGWSSDARLVSYKTDGAGWAASFYKTADGSATGGAILSRIEDAGSYHVAFYYGATLVGSITSSSTTTTYSVSSDYRLKENVVPITGALSRLGALKPSRFNFKSDPSVTIDGFLAHEAQEVVPEAVVGEKDGATMQGIDHSKLVPLLTAALQEASAQITALEARIAALEA